MEDSLTPQVNPVAPPAPPPNPALSMPPPSESFNLPQGQGNFQHSLINRLLDMVGMNRQPQAALSPDPAPQVAPATTPLPTSSTSTTPRSSNSSEGSDRQQIDINQLPRDPQTGLPVIQGIDARPDQDGYPTNPEYLDALGWDSIEANRQLVSLTQQYDQLQQILADPAARTMYFQEYDRQLQQLQQQQPQRPEFPGQSGYQPQMSAAQAFNQAIRAPNPVDNLNYAAQAWAQVPAQYQIEQILSTFPEID